MEWARQFFEAIKNLVVWWVIVNPWEMGIRSRLGKTSVLLNPGIHFKIPFVDTVFVQPIRERVVEIRPQTSQTKDGKIVTLILNIGYKIEDIGKVYNKIHYPESTVSTIAIGEAALALSENNMAECTPKLVESYIVKKISDMDIGVNVTNVSLVTFAEIRTYRVIRDEHWASDGSHYEEKK